jgi:predicted helicase
VKAVCQGFEQSDRGQLIMACGTGKTLVGLWTAERLDCRRTLVLLPSLSLLAQTMREWAANSSQPFARLAVCSDETVTEEDHLVEHTSELGLPVTTDPEKITKFLRYQSPRVVFATYQSSGRLAEACQAGSPTSTSP